MATVSTHHIKAAIRGAQRKGTDCTELLLRAGINTSLLDSRDRIDEEQMTRLVKLIWKELQDEFMGFTASRCKNGSFAMMCEMAIKLDNLQQFIQQGIRFYNLITDDIQMQLQQDQQQARINFTLADPSLDPDHFYSEFWQVIWHRLPSWFIGESIHLQEAHFSYPKPAHSTELKLMFPCKLRFNQPCNSLIFNSRYLKKPLLRNATEIQQYLEQSPANLMTIPGEDQSLIARVERKLAASSAGSLPNLAEMAKQLNMTTHTLHRHLQKEGSSYLVLKNNLRCHRAIELLVEGNQPISEISSQLGFTEPGAFSRAFKQWTGMSPRNFIKARKPKSAT